MKILENSSRDLIPIQKQHLYRYCVLLIALYEFQLWYYNKTLLSYPLKKLRRMQRRVALWISGTFHISPTLGIEAIDGLIPIYLHLQKLNGRFHLRAHSLSQNHIIKSILEMRSSNDIESHWLSLERLMPRQCAIIKGSIVDMDNRFNKVFLSFSLFNYEFLLGNRLIDIFSNHFSFHSLNKKSNHNIKSYLLKLNSITLQALWDSYLVIVIIDVSIKNQVATLISHVHIYDRLVIKTIHHIVNIMSTEAKLFVIRYGINQAIYLPNVKYIFVITDSIHTAKRIFDSLSHPYQIHLVAISSKLREFFQKDSNNSIEFWDCPNDKWSLYNIVDKETKKFNLTPIFPYKSSWDLSRKNKYNTILNDWKMFFQVSNDKGQNF